MIDLAYIEILTGETLLPTDVQNFANLSYVRKSILYSFPLNCVFEKATAKRVLLVILYLILLLKVTAERQMAYPAYLENYVAVFIGGLLPSFTVLSFTFIVPPLLKRIVHEKETGVKARARRLGGTRGHNFNNFYIFFLNIKELMKLMGLPNWMHWMTWFISAISTSLISIGIMIILICVEWTPGTGKLMAFSDAGVLYFFILLYAMSLVIFLFSISTFFESRKSIKTSEKKLS